MRKAVAHRSLCLAVAAASSSASLQAGDNGRATAARRPKPLSRAEVSQPAGGSATRMLAALRARVNELHAAGSKALDAQLRRCAAIRSS